MVQSQAVARRYGCGGTTTSPSILAVDNSLVVAVPPSGDDIVFDFGGSTRLSLSDIQSRLGQAEAHIASNQEVIASNQEAIASNADSVTNTRADVMDDLAAAWGDLNLRAIEESRRLEQMIQTSLDDAAANTDDAIATFSLTVSQQVDRVSSHVQDLATAVESQFGDLTADVEGLVEDVGALDEFVEGMRVTDYEDCFDDLGDLLESHADVPHCLLANVASFTMPSLTITHNKMNEGRCAGCESPRCCRGGTITYDRDPMPLIRDPRTTCTQKVEWRVRCGRSFAPVWLFCVCVCVVPAFACHLIRSRFCMSSDSFPLLHVI